MTEDQRWALLEFIAHISTEDWEAMTMDLKTLGFIPQEVCGYRRGCYTLKIPMVCIKRTFHAWQDSCVPPQNLNTR